MALCKFLKGDSSRISTDITPFHEGWVYVTKDGYMYIDLNLGTESSPNNQRVKLNASDAETLFGASLSKIMNSSDGEIPTSKAVMDELKKYALASHNHDDVYYTEDEIDSKISTLNTEIDKKSDTGHNHVIGDVTNLQSSLDSKVPASRKINNKELTADITLSASDVGAAASTHDHNGVYAAVGHNHNDKYYTETEVNTLLAGKANATHAHSISDVEELQATLDDKVNTRTMVNGKALNTDVVLTPSDIAGAATTTDVSNAKKEAIDYTDQKIANLLNNTTPAIDSITELAEAMQDNADAIEALKEIAAGHADADHTHDNYASSVTVTGSGNAITAISQTGNKITATKGSTFLTAHPSVTKTTDGTSTASPKHGESFTAVDSVTRDGNGHVTKINTKTVTLPSETSLSKGTDISGAETLKHGGSFTVVTDTSVSGHVITDNNVTFTLPSETTLTKGTDATAAKTLEYGKTFTAVTDTAVSGHKITDTTTTFTMPSVDTALSGTSANPVQNKVVKDALDNKADKSEGVLYIEGTGTTDTTNKVATWIGSHDDITEYFAGLTILYKIGTAGSTTTTLNINGLGAVNVVRNATTAISTAIPVNGIVLLTYTIDSDGTAYWKTADYDSNTKTTTGTSNKTGTKLYLAGATSQSSSGATTYSNKNVYIGTDNSLYSNGTKVSVEGHTHNYAGSQSAGGSANSAVRLDASGGSATQPVYFKDGQPVATTYALNKTVPADAVFTDTTYGEATTATAGLMSATDKLKVDNSILFTTQSLTDSQKEIARTNIGAASDDQVDDLSFGLASYSNGALVPNYLLLAFGAYEPSATIGNMIFYHVSDDTPKIDTTSETTFIGTCAYTNNGDTVGAILTSGSSFVTNDYAILLIENSTPCAVVAYADNITIDGATFSKKGTYVLRMDQFCVTAIAIAGYNFSNGTNELPDDFFDGKTVNTDYLSFMSKKDEVCTTIIEEHSIEIFPTSKITYSNAIITGCVILSGEENPGNLWNSNCELVENKEYLVSVGGASQKGIAKQIAITSSAFAAEGGTAIALCIGNAFLASEYFKDSEHCSSTDVSNTGEDYCVVYGYEISSDGTGIKSILLFTTDTSTTTTTFSLSQIIYSNAKILESVIPDTIARANHTHNVATASVDGLMSAGDKVKLNGIATGAEVNQNAFSNITVGSTTIAADSKTDTLTFVAGNNITLTPDATNDKITISAKDTTYTLNSFGVTATATELNVLDGITATTAELNYVDGVTSNIQTQLNNKVPTTRTVNGKALSANISLSASDVGADASGTASNTVSTHNTNSSAHNDIRLLITNLTNRLDTVANSTDKDLDQLSEIVAYIKSNKELIDAITTSKVSVSDIINNLTTNVSNKPLSAAQGVALKKLIDEIVVPTKVSELTNDSGYLTEHPDITVFDHAEHYGSLPTSYGQIITILTNLTHDENGHVTSWTENNIMLPTVDGVLSDTSTDPVQNKVVTAALNEKANAEDLVGKNVTGQNLTVDGSNAVFTASNGAEIFNDYEYNVASGEYSHAEGCGTSALGDDSHAEGLASMTIGFASHAEGYLTTAAGDHSHAEGYGILGNTTILSGDANTTTYTVTGWHSGCKVGRYIAYGNVCALIVEASSDTSTLVLDKTLSTEALSGAECILISNGIAYGKSSHVEGNKNIANGANSHAEGSNTKANGASSHAEGAYTIASSYCQHVNGTYNIEDPDENYIVITGNGDANSSRSNAHTLDWSGNAWFAGDVRVGGTGYDDGDAVVTTKEQTLTDTQKEQVRTNIGAAPVYTYGETDLEAGVSELATGTLYFVYE